MTALPLDASVPPAVEAGAAASLQERLADRLAVLRRSAVSPASLERRIALAGGALVAAGVVLVVLGWYGAAHTSRVYLQIPYLISGGLLGVALAVAGGCAYLASWLTRLVQDQRDRTDEAIAAARDTTAAMARIEALLEAALSAGAPSDVASNGAAVAGGLGDLVATPSGKLAHRPTCPTVVGRTDLRSVSLGSGLTPCRMCDAGHL